MTSRKPLSAETRAKISVTRKAQETAKKQALLSLGALPGMPGATPVEQANPPIIEIKRIQAYTGVLGGMTLGRLQGILQSTDVGLFRDWMEYCDRMVELDPHLMGLVSTRINAVAGKPLSVQPRVDSPEAKQAAQFVEEQLSELRDLNSLVAHLLWATFTGISASELIWEFLGGVYKVTSFQNLHGKFLALDTDLKPIFGPILAMSQPELAYKRLSDFPHSFIVHEPQLLSPMPNRDGLFRSIAITHFQKRKAIQFHLAGAEAYAFPRFLVQPPPQADPAIMQSILAQMDAFSPDRTAIIKQPSTFTVIAPQSQGGGATWTQLEEFCNSEMTKAITGGTLTVDAGANGSYALGEVHERVRADLSVGDAERLARTLERCLVLPILENNRHLFNGRVPPVPSLYFDGVAKYPTITALHVQTGSVRKNDLRRELALPLFTDAEGGEEIARILEAPPANEAPPSVPSALPVAQPTDGVGPEVLPASPDAEATDSNTGAKAA